jgi:hypothetical protein
MRAPEVAGRAGKASRWLSQNPRSQDLSPFGLQNRVTQKSRPVRDEGSVTYSAAVESAATLDTSPNLSDFAARVLREATRRGFSEVLCPVVWGMARPGSGTRLQNSFLKPLRFSTVSMLKNASAQWARPFMEAARKASHGFRPGMTNSIRATPNPWYERCEVTWAHTSRHENVSVTSGIIVAGCGIRNFTNKVSAPRLGWWRLAAKL